MHEYNFSERMKMWIILIILAITHLVSQCKRKQRIMTYHQNNTSISVSTKKHILCHWWYTDMHTMSCMSVIANLIFFCWKVKYKRDRLLTHPVVAALIHDKWKSIYGVFSFAQWFIYIVFLCCTTTLLFKLPNPRSTICIATKGILHCYYCY